MKLDAFRSRFAPPPPPPEPLVLRAGDVLEERKTLVPHLAGLPGHQRDMAIVKSDTVCPPGEAVKVPVITSHRYVGFRHGSEGDWLWNVIGRLEFAVLDNGRVRPGTATYVSPNGGDNWIMMGLDSNDHLVFVCVTTRRDPMLVSIGEWFGPRPPLVSIGDRFREHPPGTRIHRIQRPGDRT